MRLLERIIEIHRTRQENDIRLVRLTRSRGLAKALEIVHGDPKPGTEEWYNKHAKLDCDAKVKDEYGVCGCSGLGMVWYGYDVGERDIAPCIRCYPDDAQAKAAHEKWKRANARPYSPPLRFACM